MKHTKTDEFQAIDPWKSEDLVFTRRHLPHLEVPQATYFVSFSCRDRLQLPSQARDLVMAAIRSFDGEAIDLDGAVVMPDHVHAIFRLIGSCALTHVLKHIKGTTAHQINRLTGGRGRVWTQESFDHIVRHDAEWEEKMKYVIQNPVRKGLVASPDKYRWIYVRAEIVPLKKVDSESGGTD